MLPPDEEDGRTYDVVVIDRESRTWWAAVYGEDVEAGIGAPDRVIIDSRTNIRWVVYDDEMFPEVERSYTSPDAAGLDRLLKPSRLARCFDFIRTVETAVSGRAAIRLECVPTDRLLWEGRSAWTPDADRYVFILDATYGILLRLDAYIHQQLVSRCTLWDLSFDMPVDTGLISPPPPRRWGTGDATGDVDELPIPPSS